MKKKFYLALLLIAALCLSAASMAQADPQRLVGTWEMEDGDGKFEDDDDEYDVTADGLATFKISNVAPNGDEPTEGTLTFSFSGEYELELLEDNTPVALPLTMTMTFGEGTVDYEEDEEDEDGNTFILTGVEIDVDELDDPLTVDIKINLTDPSDVEVTISFEEATIEFDDGDDGTIEIVSGELTFTATKVPPKPNRPSSSGGCNTGAGFGLFLALGALAVFKRAKRKP